jgi:hypothetical protein
MKKFLIILPAIIVSISGYAQDWFSKNNRDEKIPGFIVGMSGDTIEGYINYDYPIIMQKRILFFSSDVSSESAYYSPDDIWGFSISDKKWISTSVIMETYNGQYKFKRFGILKSGHGPIQLLRIFDEGDKQKKKMNSEEAEKELNNSALNYPDHSLDKIYIKKNEGDAEMVLSKEFKKSFIPRMNSYIGDNRDLMQKVKSKEYTITNIYTIVSEYNKWFETKQ